jgi:hypothetical protein
VIVKVTQEHIDKGRKVDYNVSICSNCPIAFALKDTFKVEEAFASYGYLRIGAFPENLIFEVNTPEQVVQWMLNFDTKNDKYIEDKDFNSYVQPFEFELSLEGVKL